MASTYSTNIGLEKQDGEQYYDLNVVNANLDRVDDAFGSNNLVLTATSVSALPWVFTNSKIKGRHRVVNMILSNPAAQLSDWSYSTVDGQLTLSGTISGTTHIYLYLAEIYGLSSVSGVKINAWASMSESNGYKSLGTIASVSDLGDALDIEVTNMASHSIRNIYFTYNNGSETVNNDSVFRNNQVFHGAIIKNTSSTGVRVFFYSTNSSNSICGEHTANGWFFTFAGSQIKMTGQDATWERIWNKLDTLYNGDSATVYINNTPMALISSGARTGEIMTGVVSRINTSTFHFFMRSANGRAVSANLTGASATAIGTYSETLYAKCTESVMSSSNVLTFEVPYHKYMILLYAGHMMSIFNANSASTQIFSSGDVPSTANGFTLTKAANSNNYTLTRTNGESFFWATMIL